MNGKDEGGRMKDDVFYLGRTWWWNGANGKVKIGVLEAYEGAWMVGWVSKTGGRHKLNSSALSKHQLGKDAEALLKIVSEWAVKRDLRVVVE